MKRNADTPLVVVKTGSRFLLSAEGEMQTSVAREMVQGIKSLRALGCGVIWVASGAVGRGKAILKIDQQRSMTVADLQATSAVGQGRLFAELTELFSEMDLTTAQMLLTSTEVANRDSYIGVRDALAVLLESENQIVPIINENDSITGEGVSFGNNDFLAAQIAALVGATRLILLTNVPGVFTDDPSQSRGGTVISTIEDVDSILEGGFSRVSDKAQGIGTGGMRSKLRAAQLAALRGVPCVIGSLESGSLPDHAFGHSDATTVLARPFDRGNRAGFKFWLLHARPSQGEIVVDDGAKNAIQRNGASLLSVGVVGVRGEFRPGDAVYVVSQKDETIAKGIVEYSARELENSVSARLSQEQVPVLSDEVIHRDALVLVPETESQHRVSA